MWVDTSATLIAAAAAADDDDLFFRGRDDDLLQQQLAQLHPYSKFFLEESSSEDAMLGRVVSLVPLLLVSVHCG